MKGRTLALFAARWRQACDHGICHFFLAFDMLSFGDAAWDYNFYLGRLRFVGSLFTLRRRCTCKRCLPVATKEPVAPRSPPSSGSPPLLPPFYDLRLANGLCSTAFSLAKMVRILIRNDPFLASLGTFSCVPSSVTLEIPLVEMCQPSWHARIRLESGGRRPNSTDPFLK